MVFWLSSRSEVLLIRCSLQPGDAMLTACRQNEGMFMRLQAYLTPLSPPIVDELGILVLDSCCRCTAVLLRSIIAR